MSESLAVNVSSAGRFYAFDLARQLDNAGHLSKLFTAYPIWKVDGPLKGKAQTFPWVYTPALALGRLGFQRIQEKLSGWVTVSFDRWVAKQMGECDVFHALASFGLYSHRSAKQRFNALTICDRGSAHIRFQQDLLNEEHEIWGVAFQPADPGILERELREYEECDRIFVPSSFAGRTFIHQGISTEKLVTIPYGVDLSLFRPEPKQDKKFRVIYVGNLSLRKGIPYLLEAIERVNIKDFELWLVGNLSSQMRPFLRRHEERIKHFGILSRNMLYKYYSQASVFVLPSVEDGFGLVMAQAMACGLPVIATENTGAADLYTDGVEGFIVPVRDSQALSEKIQFLHENPDVQTEMGRAAMKRTKALPGWVNYGDEIILAYRSPLFQAQH